MHAVRARGAGHVKTIVDQETSGRAARDLRGSRNELIKHPDAQVFLANLKQREFEEYRGFDEVNDEYELQIVRSCCAGHHAARDRVPGWAWKVQRHCS